MMDSSSVKASPVAGPRGFDGAKKVHGIKRHILVDTAGILIAATVTPANVQDRAAFPALLRKAKRVAPTIAHLWLDKGYTGHTYTGHTVAESATQAGVSIDVVSGPKPANGFQVQPRRRVVERTNSWINHCRRLDRHYEVTLTAHEGFLYLSQIALLLRRLDRTQLFDTL
jgi:transposase